MAAHRSTQSVHTDCVDGRGVKSPVAAHRLCGWSARERARVTDASAAAQMHLRRHL